MRSLAARILCGVGLLLGSGSGLAATHFVSPTGSHTSPFTTWATAATNIQAAIDVAVAGETVLVTNGTYQSGGRVAPGSATTNRVVLDKAITLQSVNGPGLTTIRGAFQPAGTNGNAAIRCVWMTNGAVLAGFTLTNGATRLSDNGGGAWCQSTAAAISNCVIAGNAADSDGGGALFGTLRNCTLTGNTAAFGGGASSATLRDCVLSGNRASFGGGALGSALSDCTLIGNVGANLGGGVSGGTLTNCLLRENVTTNRGGGAYGATLFNCTLATNTAAYGGGAALSTLQGCTVISNIAQQLGGGAYTSTLRRCQVSWNITGAQGGGACDSALNDCVLYQNFSGLEGGGAVSSRLVNCTLVRNGAIVRGGGVRFSQVANSIVFYNLSGLPPYDEEGSSFTNSCTSIVSGGAGNLTNEPQFVLVTAGNLRLLPSSPCLNAGSNGLAVGGLDLDGNARTNQSIVDIGAYELGYHYVARSNPTPVAPYLTWGTAATSIQDAVDAAYVGSAILVSNGVYDTGGRAAAGSALTNRVLLHKALLVKSANGPAVTTLLGQGPLGDEAVRCAWLTNGAALIGFTLTNGATRVAGDDSSEQGGGGAWCQSAAALISACRFSGNAAGYQGGGAYGGTINNCIFRGNQAATGGGASFKDNPGSLNNCLLTGNTAGGGGGVREGALNNCTVCDNSATFTAGGVTGGTQINCIVYFNTAGFLGQNYSGGTFAYSCTTPDPGGTGNFTGDPLFRNRAGGDYRLAPFSLCTDDGNNASAPGLPDLDGSPRIDSLAGTVDMGAYELHRFYALAGNSGAAYPFNSGATAASNIQQAVDAAYAGAAVLVYSGLYDTGGRAAPGSLLTNRVVIDKPLFVQGLAIPEIPAIKGAGPVGDGAVRCVWMTNEVVLMGVNLVSGATRSTGDDSADRSGGGVWATSAGALIQGCGLMNNAAASDGGGALGGRLESCLLRGNSAGFGGGASFYFNPGSLINCTVVSNSAGDSGGVYGGLHANSIVQFNQATSHSNHDAATFTYSCVSPNPGGTGNFDANPQFRNAAAGDYTLSYRSPCWDAGDRTQVMSSTALYGGARIYGATVDVGAYEIGVVYVDVNNTNTFFPYTSWATAANSIQDAIGFATYGGIVLVSNGVYQTGGYAANDSILGNRVRIPDNLLVKSVNGPGVTAIRGQGPAGTGAVRCVWLGNGATLEGFTLTNGATRTTGDDAIDQSGGGVFCPSGGGTVSRCRIVNNAASTEGGGVSGGLINNSLLKDNGALYGGGASFTYASGFLNNCTVVGNSSFGAGGGVKGGLALNSIVYGNFGSGSPNYDSTFFAYSCTTPDPAGDHCITNNPTFENAAGGNYRLNFTSPCIEAGYNFEAALPTDLDGNVRILGNTVEMGAYEYTANVVDSDGDGYVDHDELVAGTQPTNSASYFRVSRTLMDSGFPAFEYSVASGRVYTVETRDSLLALPDWTPSGTFTSLVDSGSTGVLGVQTTRFVRIKVRLAP